MRFVLYLCLVFSEVTIILSQPSRLYESSPCTNPNNQSGTCTQRPKCPAISGLLYHNLTTCNFVGLTEVVCCPASTSSRMTSSRVSEIACETYTSNSSDIVFPTIYGGKAAKPGQFPFMAALGLYSDKYKIYKFSCGGTIISERFVVTAAHCLVNPDEDKVKVVRMGVLYLPESSTEVDPKNDFRVKGVEVHPNYTRRYEINDIALIELEDPLVFRDDLRPACLFSNGTRYPAEFVITGWGGVDQNNRKSDILQRATVYHLPLQDCKQKYAKYQRPISTSQVCAYHNLSDTCLGDSGGPMVVRNADFPVLVGVTSFGRAGCGGGAPSVYTSISQYLDWIEGIVWKNRS